MNIMRVETQKYLCILEGLFYGLVLKGRQNTLQTFPSHPPGASQIKTCCLHELN